MTHRTPDQLLVDPAHLAWRCPRRWLRPGPEPQGDPLLWGQERATEGLRVLAALAGRPDPHHLELTGPARSGWGRAIVGLLRAEAGDALPVLLADRPTARRLRGADEPGLCQQADGGVLVVEAEALVANEGAWAALREAMSLGAVAPDRKADAVEPPAEPRPARLSAVIVGTEAALKKLRDDHLDAPRLLARRLDLAVDAPRDRSGVAVVVALLRRHAREAGLGEVTEGALRWLVEALAAFARRDRLPLYVDLARQALSEARVAHPVGALGAPRTSAAWARIRERRAGREDLHRARIPAGLLQVETTGERLGVVNGLMVYGQARQAYAMPGRITARVAVGRQGLINVEREAKYSGRSFDKGIFQLAGLMRGLFATRSPLGLAASLVFEQSYGRVDGDSATLAEALALFSCLADLGCRQDVAVSGAINQRGDVLPIGSASLKVRGWWRTCREQGLTGSQGVVLPAASVADLQLSGELARDIREGRFSIWEAATVEEAIAVVLGRPAGLRPGKGFASGSVYARAARRLQQMSERLHPPRPKPGGKGKPKPKPAAATQEGAAPTEAPVPAQPEEAPPARQE